MAHMIISIELSPITVYVKTIFIPQDNLTDNFWPSFTCHIIEYREKFDNSYLSL